MVIDFYQKTALLSACQSAQQPVAFLIGSALSRDTRGGVPNVKEFIEIVRNEVSRRNKRLSAALDKQLVGVSGSLAYQTALKFLHGHFTQAAVNDVVQAVVLKARKTTAGPLTKGDGSPSDWTIPKGLNALAVLLSKHYEQFSGPVLTTNFDPLASLAYEAKGGVPCILAFDKDAAVVSNMHTSSRGCDFIHIHGYWRGGGSLHTPSQLSSPRSELKSSLKKLLKQHTLL